MKNIEKNLLIFIVGGLGYGAIEILFRNYTHWSMIITGGSSLLCIYIINKAFRDKPIFLRALYSSLAITTMELTVGIVVNNIFNFAVWDYTNTPANFMGIISLPFSACWYAISFILIILINLMKKIKLQIHDTPLHHVLGLEQK